ncbi:hypothetical protein TNCT_62961 [Trichonephila clavata]|uniref:Uncharacterized protein n=1 Tax=Trichonephila clavata TaxID=2740835 RepID=A0A8X6M4D7_TRICU|nr:hypothetical protein TNCT_62961 [Trichonephila clavata]
MAEEVPSGGVFRHISAFFRNTPTQPATVSNDDVQSESSPPIVSRRIEYHNIGCLTNAMYALEPMRNSKYFILLLLIFFALSLSLVVIGFGHLAECPASPETPIHVSVIGILGVTIISLRIVVIGLRINWQELESEELTTAVVISSTALVSILAGEMMSFFYMSRDFNPASEKFCNEAFYNYTYYMNFMILATAFIAVLLHIPKCRFTFSNFYSVL